MRSIAGMITSTREPKLNVAPEDHSNAGGEDREDTVCEPTQAGRAPFQVCGYVKGKLNPVGYELRRPVWWALMRRWVGRGVACDFMRMSG